MLQSFVKKSVGFTAGGLTSAYFVLKMDDMVYSQLRRHIILPFRMVTNQQGDISELGTGTRDFIYQFRPLAMKKTSAKQLLLDDHDYSTP